MTLPDDNLPDPSKIQKFFDSWRGVATSIATTIAGALASFQIGPPWNYIIACAVTATGLAIAVFLYRREVRRKTKADETEQELKNARSTSPGAFRGLRRFLRGETLPGSQRRRQAAQLFNQVIHPDFKIALVTGDSGAGKSSMLECAVFKALEDAAIPVVMVSNAAQLGSTKSTTNTTPTQISAVTSEIDKQIAKRGVDATKGLVLILDQFEELLSQIRSPEDRVILGDFLWNIITNGVRLVLAIRREYVIDVKAITDRFAYTVSFENTFLIQNFDVSEATAVIQECATQDKLKFDADLPRLIAEDLAIDGQVRPPDLQIVCTALSGDLTSERYKREGRAAGLRSRFVRDVIDISGDAVLARTVLRQLCDIPNNKKTPEPLRSEDIAARAQNGAPGQRATLAAVTSVLRALEQARVVVSIDTENGPRWSLIHDYIVEPIKLATEIENTLGEAAVARLEYFLARAATLGAAIPLSDLRLILRDAPPAAIRQNAAKRLIRRSLLVGYGAPTIGALGVSFIAVCIIMVGATEHQWKVIDEKNHWDEARSSGRGSVRGTTVELASRPKEKTVVLGNPFGGSSRLTAWDAETGALLGAQTGTLRRNILWDYNAGTGRLSRRDATGKEIWGETTPSDNRPSGEIYVSYWEDPIVYFSEERTWSKSAAETVFNLRTHKWNILNREAISPSATGGGTFDFARTTTVDAQLVSQGKPTRLTIWTRDYTKLLFDEQWDAPDDAETGPSILNLQEAGSQTTLAFTKGKTIETISFDSAQLASLDKLQPVAGQRRTVKLPPGLDIHVDGFNRFRGSGGQVITKFGERVVIVDPVGARTFLWIFNPASAAFEDPAIGGQWIYMPGTGLAWMPEGETDVARLWFEDSPDSIRIKGLQFGSKGSMTISESKSRAIVVSTEGAGTLWDIDLASNKAKPIIQLSNTSNDKLSFSDDDNLVVRRQPGGGHQLWDKNGVGLGTLGILGSEVTASTYQEQCARTIFWTQEGQRLDFRRGFNVPLVGFIPEKSCNSEVSRLRQFLAGMLKYFVR
jgi:hypothetical protein